MLASSSIRNRGAYRVAGHHWDPRTLAQEVRTIPEHAWKPLPHGDAWSQIVLQDQHGRGQPLLEKAPAIRSVIDWFPGEVLDATLARLSPGGWVKEHRDLSGGAPMGVSRFHVPIVTHQDVQFLADRKPIFMGAGELWVLDTSYLHSLRNASNVRRVHLIVDVKRSDAVVGLLPKADFRDRLHMLHFAGICAAKGATLACRDPRAMARRARDAFKLRVLGRSVFNFE